MDNLTGDTRELAQRHAIEHAESIHVPPVKMGTIEWYQTLQDSPKTQPTTLSDSQPNPTGKMPSAGVEKATTAPPAKTDTTSSMTHQERKRRPLATGVLDYFPDALMEVAYCSWVGNEQHNPGEPLHWAKEKSTDEPDALLRHLKDRGTIDSDGVRHSAKVAWRALAMLQREIESERS